MGKTILVCLLLLTLDLQAQQLPRTSRSDSAWRYYNLGWQEIMDNGRYGLSENYFRKASQFDPEFLLARAQIARLSKDSLERKTILQQIRTNRNSVNPDVALLLDDFAALIELTNLREAGKKEMAREKLSQALKLSENNLRTLVRKYPDERYHLCEYIEVIYYQRGAGAALDTLRALRNQKLENTTFMIGFQAQLLTDLGDIEGAEKKIEELKRKALPSVPKYFVVRATVALKRKDWETARESVSKALSIDPLNIDAQRLSAQLK
jgi:tetratricopeptide (TPR) repeat protein